MEQILAQAYQELVDSLRLEFGFDFVGIAPVPREVNPDLTWKYASGNTNNRFRRIVLPPGIGVMGVVYGSERPMIVENVTRDIPRKDQYQYPIVAAEGLVTFFALPLKKSKVFASILICAYREDRAIPESLIQKTAEFIQNNSPYFAKIDSPVRPSHNVKEAIYSEITHKILQAQEEERKRIARELHDGILQELLLAQIELRKLKYLPEDEKDQGIEQASDYLRDIMKQVNTMATGLRPASLDELGLAPAIDIYCITLQDAYGVTISSHSDPEVSLPGNHETALYRIFQEAAMNACKYSRSDSIEVTLKEDGGTVVLTVKDYGVGFDAKNPIIQGSGLGIAGMKERADLIGGTFSCISHPDKGTIIEIVVHHETN